MLIRSDLSSPPIVSLEHVWKRYPNGTQALSDICLRIPDGDFVFLVGPSGAGKSTLVRLLIREERPSQGRVWVDGLEVGGLPRRELPRLRRQVGLVFQDFKLLPRLSAAENVAFALRVSGESRRTVQQRCRAALEAVGLWEERDKYPCELSGGEQQRVAIARALVHGPRLLVADEPTGNLDPATAWEVMQALLAINAAGTTVLMATHNRDIVDLMRRRVVALDRGQVVRDQRAGRYDAAPQVLALRP
jgi:cell division transport system ATP-binding protein